MSTSSRVEGDSHHQSAPSSTQKAVDIALITNDDFAKPLFDAKDLPILFQVDQDNADKFFAELMEYKKGLDEEKQNCVQVSVPQFPTKVEDHSDGSQSSAGSKKKRKKKEETLFIEKLTSMMKDWIMHAGQEDRFAVDCSNFPLFPPLGGESQDAELHITQHNRNGKADIIIFAEKSETPLAEISQVTNLATALGQPKPELRAILARVATVIECKLELKVDSQSIAQLTDYMISVLRTISWNRASRTSPKRHFIRGFVVSPAEIVVVELWNSSNHRYGIRCSHPMATSAYLPWLRAAILSPLSVFGYTAGWPVNLQLVNGVSGLTKPKQVFISKVLGYGASSVVGSATLPHDLDPDADMSVMTQKFEASSLSNDLHAAGSASSSESASSISVPVAVKIFTGNDPTMFDAERKFYTELQSRDQSGAMTPRFLGEVVVDGGLKGLVMEEIKGGEHLNLQHLRQWGPHIMKTVSSFVCALHQLNYVHNDLRSSNILIVPPKLVPSSPGDDSSESNSPSAPAASEPAPLPRVVVIDFSAMKSLDSPLTPNELDFHGAIPCSAQYIFRFYTDESPFVKSYQAFGDHECFRRTIFFMVYSELYNPKMPRTTEKSCLFWSESRVESMLETEPWKSLFEDIPKPRFLCPVPEQLDISSLLRDKLFTAVDKLSFQRDLDKAIKSSLKSYE